MQLSRFRRILLVLLLLGSVGCGPDADDPAGDAALLVLVVVDQLRADLLERYGEGLEGGFARLRRNGSVFPDARVDHALSNSGPGHATLATGSHPARHGIVDNGFFRPVGDGAWAYGPAPLDSTARVLGRDDEPGYSSATRLAPALGDWARARDPGARSVSIGQGAHSSNAMAARAGGQAYWFSAEAGGYVTSSHYLEAYPAWVEGFNAERLPALMADTVWEVAAPSALRSRALPDTVPWEIRGGNGRFPHTPGRDLDPGTRSAPDWRASWFQTTPGIDAATLALAREAVRGRELGTRGTVDVLTLNLSSLDEAGHRFGPWSVEQLDALWRLDRELGAFLDFLDEAVGEGRWALALSADHGAATPPEQVEAEGGVAHRISLAAMDSAWAEVARRVDGVEPRDRRFRIAREVLEDRPWVARVYAVEELEAGPSPGEDEFLPLYRRSYHPERRIDFPLYDRSGRTDPVALGIGAIRMAPDAMMDFAASIHGSPYDFDRRVPILLAGSGVEAGRRSGGRTADVAPTLARLGGLPVPAGVDGRDLLTPP